VASGFDCSIRSFTLFDFELYDELGKEKAAALSGSFSRWLATKKFPLHPTAL
jgi:hypothetical protein